MQTFEYWFPGADNLSAYTSGGTLVTPAKPVSGSDVAGLTLVNGTTYYIPISSGDNAPISLRAAIMSFHLKWNAALAAVFTLETTNFSKYLEPGINTGPIIVSDYDATVGNWQQWNPPSAYVPFAGAGNSAAAATVTAGGTAAGSCVFDLALSAVRRVRIKAVVTTGGLLRVGVNGKVGA